MSEKGLAVLGQFITHIDREIISSIARRMRAACEIEQFKAESGMPILRPNIEEERMLQYSLLAKESGLSAFFIQSIFYQIYTESAKMQLAQREGSNLNKTSQEPKKGE